MPDDSDAGRSSIERLTTTVDEQLSSRRGFLAGSAALGTGALVGGLSGSGLAAGDHGGSNGNESNEAGNGNRDDSGGMANDGPSDVEILNFARTLEFLEATFYADGLDNLGCSGVMHAESIQRHGPAITDDVHDELRTIRDHEEEHAAVLGEVITDLGGEPVDRPTFDFGEPTDDPDEFLGLAAQLETTGVAAYAGAAPLIDDEDLVPPALGIHSVEARHTSYLNVLTDETGFPNVIDQPLSMDEVLDIAGQFIVEE